MVGLPVDGDHLSVNVEKGIFTVVKAPGAVFGTVKGALKHPPDKGKLPPLAQERLGTMAPAAKDT